MKNTSFLLVALMLLNLGVCSLNSQAAGLRGLFDRKNSEKKARALHEKVETAIGKFKEKDPSIKRFFEKSKGYAVFPSVVKAGIGFGGAMGKGEVFEAGKVVGVSTMTQASVVFQLGGQAYSEIIFFDDEKTLSAFKKGTFEFGAQVSAVAVTVGASDNATFDQGMAVFTMEKGGLMYEASVGGQVFSYDERK